MQVSSIFIKGIVQSQKVKLNVQLVLILPEKIDLFAYNFHNQFIYSKITGKFHNARYNGPISFITPESAQRSRALWTKEGHYKGIMKFASYFTIYKLIMKIISK